MENSDKGIIFDIGQYMTEDGPGIRTVIFMKGCPLRCKWCSNAYGLEPYKQLSYMRQKCTGCGKCVSVCPSGACVIGEDLKAETDFSACSACGACVQACPSEARTIIGKGFTVAQVVDEIEKNRMFYRRRGGGATFSGGEVLLQHEFVCECLKECCNRMISTAIETSAFGKWEHLKSLIDYSDIVFIDIKHMDSEEHKHLTGVDNSLILENIRQSAEYISSRGKKLVARLPLIPSVNDSDENISATAAFASSLCGNIELNILPYHNLGEGKYEFIGKSYGLSAIGKNSKSNLERVAGILDGMNAKYSIGGGNVKSY